MASSNPNNQSQPHPVPVLAMRRCTILACANCRKRKMTCITTEQPPKTPCARCVKKHLPCEYVAAAEPEYSPNSAPATAEFPVSDLPYGRTPSGPAPTRWNPPTAPPTFHGGHGAAPPPSLTPAPRRCNPGSADPNGPPQFNQQYYAVAQPNAGHDPRQYSNRGSTPQPPFMQPQQQAGDYPGFYYNQWVNDYDGSSSSGNQYRSNDPRYN